MELPYDERIDPNPYVNEFGWSIKKPTLGEIKDLKGKFETYFVYQSFLGMDINFFMENYASEELKKYYYTLPEEVKEATTYFDLVRQIKWLSDWYAIVFDFFSPFNVIYEDGKFLQVDYEQDITEAEKSLIVLSHIETSEDFESLRECLCSVCNIKIEKEEEFKVAPGSDYEMAKRIWDKLQAAKKAERKRKKIDKTYSLPNLIGAVASINPAYTFTTIWDLTICQFYHVFDRMQYRDQYKMMVTSISVWGDEDNRFDPTLWFKTLE